MKKINLTVLVVTLILVFVLTACSGVLGSAGSAQPSVAADDNTINILQFKIEIDGALRDAIEQYTALNPGITINLESVGGSDDYGTVLRENFNSALTIFNVGGPQDVEDWLDKLEDLSDQPWVPEAVDGTLHGVRVGGKVFGLPYAVEGYGLVYNREIFEAAQIDTETLDNYDAILSAFEILQAKIDDGSLSEQFPLLEAVVELPAAETWVTGLHGLNAALNQEFGSSLDAHDSSYVEFLHAEALKRYYDLQADFTSNRHNKAALNEIDYDTQVSGGIAIERVAVIQQGNWIYKEVASVSREVAEKLAFLPIPVVREDSIPVGVPMYWAINNEAPEPAKAAAKDFLNWLYQSEEGKDIIMNSFYFIPPFRNYVGFEPNDPLAQSVKRFADAGRTTGWVFMGFPSDWGMNVFGAGLQDYFDGSRTFEEVVSEAQEEWARARS